MVNHLRLNWPLYESDILQLGGTVAYPGVIRCRSRRSVVEKAEIRFLGRVFSVWMERFRDGTAAVSSMSNEGDELYELYEDALHCDKNTLYREFVFYRFVKHFWLLMAQLILLVVCICNWITAFSGKFVTHMAVSAISIAMVILLGNFYSKIRCYSFDVYKKDVEEDFL